MNKKENSNLMLSSQKVIGVSLSYTGSFLSPSNYNNNKYDFNTKKQIQLKRSSQMNPHSHQFKKVKVMNNRNHKKFDFICKDSSKSPINQSPIDKSKNPSYNDKFSKANNLDRVDEFPDDNYLISPMLI
jgi:hypothetical protein